MKSLDWHHNAKLDNCVINFFDQIDSKKKWDFSKNKKNRSRLNWKDFFVKKLRIDKYLNQGLQKWVIDKKLKCLKMHKVDQNIQIDQN
jgi:hypothetical protein